MKFEYKRWKMYKIGSDKIVFNYQKKFLTTNIIPREIRKKFVEELRLEHSFL